MILSVKLIIDSRILQIHAYVYRYTGIPVIVYCNIINFIANFQIISDFIKNGGFAMSFHDCIADIVVLLLIKTVS